KGNAAAGIDVAGEQRFESGLRQLGLEIARHFQDRGAGIGAIGDAGDAAFQPPRVGGLAVLERRPLYPRRVEILHLIARDDAAAEPADAGIIFCAGQSRVWAEAFVVTPSDKASSRKIGLNSMRGKLMGNPFVRETIEGSDGTKYDL